MKTFLKLLFAIAAALSIAGLITGLFIYPTDMLLDLLGYEVKVSKLAKILFMFSSNIVFISYLFKFLNLLLKIIRDNENDTI